MLPLRGFWGEGNTVLWLWNEVQIGTIIGYIDIPLHGRPNRQGLASAFRVANYKHSKVPKSLHLTPGESLLLREGKGPVQAQQLSRILFSAH